MRNCKEYQELFVEAYYDELPADEMQELMEHLASCSVCSSEFKKLETTLHVMNKRERVEPDEAYWKQYWNTLSTSLENARTGKQPSQQQYNIRFASLPGWAYGVAAMLLIAVGLYLGKFLYSPEPAEHQQEIVSNDTVLNEQQRTKNEVQSTEVQPPISQQDQGQTLPEHSAARTTTSNTKRVTPIINVVDKEARSYLNRSKIMLLGLVNSDEEDPLSLSRQQEVSRSLLQEAIDLKPRLIETDQKRVKQLIEELEVILLQLANIEEESDLPAVELVKKGVDEKSILLKINMEEMRMMKNKDSRKKSDKKEKQNRL
ncbi:MAG: zf-HC2 domain-containing protein [Bacteroidetes bacterium]|nr:MAG: zf-HC2 domain-containing protein [Bacteroidota bacterium]